MEDTNLTKFRMGLTVDFSVLSEDYDDASEVMHEATESIREGLEKVLKGKLVREGYAGIGIIAAGRTVKD